MIKSDKELASFYNLDPNVVLGEIEAKGFEPTGRLIQLNSYENRVFDIELEHGENIITKFYRPLRWSKESIQEEHLFLSEIEEAGAKTAPAIVFEDGSTVSEVNGIYWSLFPKVRGRLPQELFKGDYERIGRLLARIHNVGSQKFAEQRLTLSSETLGYPALERIEQFIAPEVSNRFFSVAEELLQILDEHLEDLDFLRIHGDCHRGNLLDSGSELFLIDLDDFCNGPAVQDFWMLVLGDQEEMEENLTSLLKGYEELRHFDHNELESMEVLRGLRLIHYAGWIARRWEDPSFPKIFPHFGTFNYWSEECEALEKILWNL